MTTTPTTDTRLATWNGLKVFASGRLYDAIEREFPICTWMVEVPSGNPEPDFPSDCWTQVPCGSALYFDAPDGMRCEHGHYFGNMERHLGAGGTEWQREQAERFEQTGHSAGFGS